MKMKFVINTLSAYSSRIGCIKDIERLPGIVFETPLLLLYTKGGSVPHLTHEVLEMVTKEPQPLHIPIATTVHCQESVEAFKKGIADFVGLKEHLTFCTIHDPAKPTPQGFNDKNTVSIWSRYGRKQLDADKYMDIIEIFHPDMYQTLCDGDTNLKSSKKRIQKSIDRTDSMLKKCLERHKKSATLRNSAFLAAVEGGYSVQARERSAREVGSSSVFGFVIDGLHNNGPVVENVSLDEVKPVVSEAVKHLPQDTFRVINGCWNPEMVVNLVEMGIDAFDSSFAYVVTERGGALVFQNNLSIPETNGVGSEDTFGAEEEKREPQSKKKRIDLIENGEDAAPMNGIFGEVEQVSQETSSAKVNISEQESYIPNRKYELQLSDKKYADDFTPISKSCSCLTCQKHTRAYVHHLLQTNELLAPVLLSIHNLHHYMEFFKGIREALKTGSLDKLKENIRKGVTVT